MPILVIPDGNAIDVKDLQLPKHSLPKLVIPEGSVIDVKDLQL